MIEHAICAPRFVTHVLDGPGQRLAQGFPEDRPTGFADGRQLLKRPFLRMALPQLFHQETVRQHDEVHVPGLALAITQLTVPHAQLLLAIPMKGLGACPAMAITAHDPMDFPLNSVRDQDDAWRGLVLVVPQDHDPDLMAHLRKTQGAGEVPLGLLPFPQRFSQRRRDARRQFRGLENMPLVLHLAVELERADVGPRLPIR